MDANLTATAPAQAAKPVGEEDIFDALGAGDIPEEEKAALLAKMVKLIEERTLDKILDGLSPEAADELEHQVLPNEDPDALSHFIEKYVPNYQELFNAEARALRLELIQDSAA